MNFESQMRIGSLAITAALCAVAFVAMRPRLRAAIEVGVLAPLHLKLRAIEFGTARELEAVCPVVIGRTDEAGLVVPDPEVSRRHARLETENDVLYLRDLGSRNGTFLNGRRVVDSIEVRAGDAIDIGATRLIVEEIAPWT